MKRLLIANWKQNKTVEEADLWMDKFLTRIQQTQNTSVEVVISASDVLLYPINKKLTSISLATQDISKYSSGAHTGETGAFQVKKLVSYGIIGHSERREFAETPHDIILKVQNLNAVGITPIICFDGYEWFSDIKRGLDPNTLQKAIFAYEPASAISSAVNSTGIASIDDVKEMFERTELESMIYGGSVDSSTVKDYLKLNFISGFLVGSASLDVDKFLSLYKVL